MWLVCRLYIGWVVELVLILLLGVVFLDGWVVCIGVWFDFWLIGWVGWLVDYCFVSMGFVGCVVLGDWDFVVFGVFFEFEG